MDGNQIVSILCACISAIGVISVAVLPIVLNHHYKKTDKLEKAYNEELRKERLEDFNSVMNPFKEEIRTEIKNIKDDISINTVGTVTMLRDRMKSVLDECIEKGFAKDSDKANWMELYNTYKSLGGNHFREYVDQWKHTMENLPSIKPSKPKKQLNEKK